MGALKVLLRDGEELALESALSTEEAIKKKPRLAALRDKLVERFTTREKMTGPDALDAANREVENLLLVALSELGDAYVEGKSAAIDRLVALHGEIQGMYGEVLRGRGEVKLDLDVLRGKYREMQGLFDELSKPATSVAEDASKARTQGAVDEIAVAATKVPKGTKIVAPEGRLSALEGRKGWSKIVDRVKKFLGMRANLRAGTVELKIENGMIVVTSTTKGGKTVTFREFDTLAEPYSKKPLSTRVMQAHHGCQNALMKRFFGRFGYSGEEAPTIWLRDSTGDSPHGVITHAMQNPNEAARMASNPTYGQIRDWAVADLKAAGAPDSAIRTYMQHMDAYFDRAVAPNLKAAGRADRIGDIKVY